MQETFTSPENKDGAAASTNHGEELGRKYTTAKGAVGDLANEVGKTARDQAGAVKSQASGWVQEKAGHIKEQASDTHAALISAVRHNPIQALAIAAGAGLLLGLLLHRGD